MITGWFMDCLENNSRLTTLLIKKIIINKLFREIASIYKYARTAGNCVPFLKENDSF